MEKSIEKRDLYDIDKQLTGEAIYKGDTIPNNKYILVVLSFIQNSRGQFLIQKRSIQKNGCRHIVLTRNKMSARSD